MSGVFLEYRLSWYRNEFRRFTPSSPGCCGVQKFKNSSAQLASVHFAIAKWIIFYFHLRASAKHGNLHFPSRALLFSSSASSFFSSSSLALIDVLMFDMEEGATMEREIRTGRLSNLGRVWQTQCCLITIGSHRRQRWGHLLYICGCWCWGRGGFTM